MSNDEYHPGSRGRKYLLGKWFGAPGAHDDEITARWAGMSSNALLKQRYRREGIACLLYLLHCLDIKSVGEVNNQGVRKYVSRISWQNRVEEL